MLIMQPSSGEHHSYKYVNKFQSIYHMSQLLHILNFIISNVFGSYVVLLTVAVELFNDLLNCPLLEISLRFELMQKCQN